MKQWKQIGKLLLAVAFFAVASAAVQGSFGQPQQVQAATVKDGWVQSGSNWYYFKNGVKMKNAWVQSSGKWYFLKPSSGAMQKSSLVNWKAKKYYVDSTGKMVTGWKAVNGYKYYFTSPNGEAKTGWMTTSAGKYFFASSGKMYTKGWHTIGGRLYYMTSSGTVKTGWLVVDGNKYYLRKSGTYLGSAATNGTYTIGTTRRTFDSKGALIKTESTIPQNQLQQSSGTRTIRNYLLEALRPVGTTSYLLGANAGTDGSTSEVPAQLDCSWYVRWTTNQVLKNNISWVKSTDTAATYAAWGLGSYLDHGQLAEDNFKGNFKAGDLVNRTGHVWIVIGQCADGSYVLVHTSPPCTQIAGTPSPDDPYNADSEAIALAQQYMSKYYQSTLDYYQIPQQGTWATDTAGFLTAEDVTSFRWSKSVLSDPEGLRSKKAAVILRNLYGE